MAAEHRFRATAALVLAIAVIAVVACVLSAADNEAARLEIAKAPAQGRVPMDYTVVERATSSALAHDVASFLMRRARGPRSVMRKRMAQAQMPHELAPVQGLVQTKKDCLHDIAFIHPNTQDPAFKDAHVDCDFVFKKWMNKGKSMDAFNNAVQQGDWLEEVSSKMKEADEEEDAAIGDEDAEEADEEEAEADTSGGGLTWDHVLDIAAKSWKGKEDSIPTPVAGHTLEKHAATGSPMQTVPNDALSNPGDWANRVVAPRKATFKAAPSMPSFGPTPSKPAAPAKTAVKKAAPPLSAPSDDAPPMTAAPPVAQTPVGDDQSDHSTTVEPDIAFRKPNLPVNTRDPDFPKGTVDPAMVRFTKGPVVVQPAPAAATLTATKTAVQLAKKAMAEHAKKAAAIPVHSSKYGFDLSAQAANNINNAKIQMLKVATAKKELKYKKALAKAHAQSAQPSAGIKFIKN